VFFTIERFLAVYVPFKRCSISANKRPIGMVVLFTLIFHSFALFASGLEVVNEERRVVCVTLSAWFNYTKIFVFIDSTLTIIIPFLLIFVFNFLIVYKLNRTNFEYNVNKNGRICSLKSPDEIVLKRNSKSIKSELLVSTSRQNTLLPNRKNTVSSFLLNSPELIYLKKFSFIDSSLTGDKSGQNNRVCLTRQFIELKRSSTQSSSSLPTSSSSKSHKQFRKSFDTNSDWKTKAGFDYGSGPGFTRKSVFLFNKQSESKKIKFTRTTYVLLMISSCFLLLNMPMAICKLWYFLNLTENKSETIFLSFQQNDSTLHEELFERVSCYIYYLNFCINFFLYNLNLLKLRKMFMSIYLAQKLPRFSQSRQIESTQLGTNIKIRKSVVSYRL
jgi:hypothetical protein